MKPSRLITWALCALCILSVADSLWAQNRGQRGPGGRGRGQMGRPEQGQRGPDDRHAADQQGFQFLLHNHQKIRRQVKVLPNGVETLTESDDPAVAAKIKEHVHWMKVRVENVKPIRMRDPLFAELFRFARQIKMESQATAKGVRVRETSDNPYVVLLIQGHASVVSLFVKNGFTEARKNHPVPNQRLEQQVPPLAQPPENGKPENQEPGDKVGQPQEPAGQPLKPVIENAGPVVRFPDAPQQPQSGSKILVDITAAAAPDELNPALDKVARYLNLYAAGGKQPATARFAIVFHGDATLAVMNEDAYGKRFGTPTNPNLERLRQFKNAGVQMFVCGQSLHAKDQLPADVEPIVQTAVSALTTVVNLQQDGYVTIPLGN